MNKIRKGDEVIVIAGKDRVRKAKGKVLARVDDSHVLVEGVNLVTKHEKPNPLKGSIGGRVSKPMPIDQSNVAIYNPKTGKADRVQIKVIKDGDKERKVRVFKSTGDEIKSMA